AFYMGLLVFIISIPATLSFGCLNHIKFAAVSIFDNIDFLVFNILITSGSLRSTLTLAELFNNQALRAHFDNDRFKLFIPWYNLIKFILPIVIILIFVVQFI